MQRIINNHWESCMGGERIGYLDAMKCLGTILVIEGHVRGYGMNLGAYDSLSGLMLYSFNMPMFFFVSGFLAYKAQRYSAKKIFKQSVRKFINLVIPAFLFVFFRLLNQLSFPASLLISSPVSQSIVHGFLKQISSCFPSRFL